MKRYARLLATYVLIAVAVVVLYAPWGLALRPWDVSLLRAGFSIICGLALATTFGASTYFALKDPDVKLLKPAEVMDDDEVVPVLEEYRETPYVGGIASDALEQVHSAARKRKRLHKVISVQFAEGSLSWDRFVNLVDQAERTVLRNAALVANSVQSFDRESYAQALRRDDSQREIFDQALNAMREIVEANERVLLELGKLELELSRLEADDTLDENSKTLDDLATLVQETKFYR